uniref:Uncharacterized protein n=1 Tax=Rhizophora mucronata TaxID=61149 RepID=A0A2P2NBV4_RHIMU
MGHVLAPKISSLNV